MASAPLTPGEQRELFGDDWSDDFAHEAEARWGDTDAWRQSHTRTKSYGRDSWARIKEESDEIEQRFADLMRSGAPPDASEVQLVVRAHRDHITRWFYDCGADLHRALGEMYVADPRFTAHYDKRAPGLATYVSAAIIAAAAEPTA